MALLSDQSQQIVDERRRRLGGCDVLVRFIQHQKFTGIRRRLRKEFNDDVEQGCGRRGVDEIVRQVHNHQR